MLAVVGSDDDEAGAGWQSWLFALEQGRAPRKLTNDSISPAGGYAPLVPAPEMRWTPSDGQNGGIISFAADARGESAVYRLDATTGGDLRRLGAGGLISQVSFDADAGNAVLMKASPDSPGDLHALDMESGALTRLSDENRDYFSEHPPARFEKFSVERGGFEIESRILYPPEL